MRTDDINKSISRDPSLNAAVTVTVDGARDANNNATGSERKEMQFTGWGYKSHFPAQIRLMSILSLIFLPKS